MSYSHEIALWARRRVLELGFAAGRNGAHIGSGMSIVDMLAVLYSQVLNINNQNRSLASRDRFILSKGHAAISLYAILEHIGLLSPEETATFESNGTSFYAHAHRDLSKGIEFSGGSLSLGLSFSVGVAFSCLRAGLNNRVFVLVGDGECDEGLIWESAMAAANYSLSNLTVIVDSNGMQSDGSKSEIMNQFSLVEKFRAFGFEVSEIDGHNHFEIAHALQHRHQCKPTAVIANTVKGKGVSFMEGNPDWHHGVLTQVLFDTAMVELGRQ